MLEEVLARCAPAAWLPGLADAAGTLGVPATLALAGLLGGFAHCAGMCGPFVLAQIGAGPAPARPAERMLWPYHLGRATTYTLLGAVAGATSGAFAGATGLRALAVGCLVIGGVGFALHGLAGFGLRLGSRESKWSAAWGRIVARLAAPFFGARSTRGGFALGLILGVLPCGLLWGALAVAAGTGKAEAGALALAAFALGTVPALGLVAWAGCAAASRFRDAFAFVSPALMLANAAFLFYFAWAAAGHTTMSL